VKNGTPHTLARISLRWMIRECFATNTGIMFSVEGLKRLGLDHASLSREGQPTQHRQPRLAGGTATIQRIPKPSPSTPPTKPECMSEEEHTRPHADVPIDDQPNLSWFWWLLEYIPMRQRLNGCDEKQGKSPEPPEHTEHIHNSEEEHERLDAVSPIYDQLDIAWLWRLLEYFPMRQRPKECDGKEQEKKYSLNRGQGRLIPSPKRESTISVHRSVQIRKEAKYANGEQYNWKARFPDGVTVVYVD
jgi:hypothetical protein